jgi:type IV pilus assembly protein PilC
MSSFAYVAIDPRGSETRGSLEVSDQSEALKRIKEMGLFPTKILEINPNRRSSTGGGIRRRRARWFWQRKVKPRVLTVFTRQLATLLKAGMPLLRSLRILEEQGEDRRLKVALVELSEAIEGGSGFAEALSMQPKVFSRLYINMVKAGEVGGAMEICLARLAEFMEKAQRIKGKVKAAMAYPCAVLFVAGGIVALLMLYVLPKFKLVFEDLTQGAPLPAFTRWVMGVSDALRNHFILGAMSAGALIVMVTLLVRTGPGRAWFDRLKLKMPLVGPVFRKASISKFSRTFGTLMSSGVPILHALTIVQETVGNVAVGKVIGRMHERVKEGDPLAPTLKQSALFPAMVAGMVDVGEQTGALPEVLLKVADDYDGEVDNAVSAMTSLLEPIMILFLALVVGSIVVAVFLPLISMPCNFGDFNKE